MERQKNMAKVFWKGSTLLAPVPPTMVSCGTMEKPNIITVAWTGIDRRRYAVQVAGSCKPF